MLRYLYLAIILLGLPVAILGVVLPVNEYASADGSLAGAVDCDGPFTVMMFAVPALIFYGAAAIRSIGLYRRGARRQIYIAIICCVASLAVIPNLGKAIQENARNDTENMCS